MLELKDIAVSWGDFTLTADLTLPERGLVGVIGPSGAGKSTLLDLIAGFVRPDRGRILWNDQDITARDPGQRPVSIVFQDANLFPHLTAAKNVGLGISPNLKLTDTDWGRVERTMESVGLPGLGTRKPAELSGGQVSRVALARVLARDRPVVLLDEPFSALGPGLRAEMLELVRDTLADRLVLMVTHDPADAAALPQAIVVGEGTATGPFDTAEMLDNPPDVIAGWLGRQTIRPQRS